jgi:hypothetical protein
MNLRWRASLTLLEQQPATPLSATLLAKKKRSSYIHADTSAFQQEDL